MMKKSLIYTLLVCSMAAFSACDANQCPDCDIPSADIPSDLVPRKLPIINGTRVTGDDYLSTVALVMDYGNYRHVFCTGTLISPNYVLTAAHCISDCDGDDPIEPMRPYMKVGIGQSGVTLRNVYGIKSFHPHPNFVCSDYEIKHDIAVIELKTSVPATVAQPTMPMPKVYDITKGEVDSSSGVLATTVGFGKTNAGDDNSSGTKYKTSYNVYAYCPAKRADRSRYCDQRGYTDITGQIYFYDERTNTCQGDSGGPTFFTRDGKEFVGGVTSYGLGEGCDFLSAVTLVSDYYDFIAGIAKDIAAIEPEDCTNGVDDNDDERIDCNDPFCAGELVCVPENCANQKDDNGNGLADCDDPQCSEAPRCQPEDCTNGVDDNENGLTDCNDSECKDLKICQPEDCANGVDDNENGLADCDDPECSGLKKCQPEICNDGIDNNDNNLIDCQDPQCTPQPLCQPEICNDNIDNNANGLIDCNDPQCNSDIHCQIENCQNGVDDNDNGLIDCQDMQCSSAIQCQPEICDDTIDNNANGLSDCNDPQCAESEVCVVTPKSSSESSCAATPRSRAPLGGFALLAFIVSALGLRRRRLD